MEGDGTKIEVLKEFISYYPLKQGLKQKCRV